jgi:hypothetical protein
VNHHERLKYFLKFSILPCCSGRDDEWCWCMATVIQCPSQEYTEGTSHTLKTY